MCERCRERKPDVQRDPVTTAIPWTTRQRTWWTAGTEDASAEVTQNDRGGFVVRVWRYDTGRRLVCRDVQSLERAQELAAELMGVEG